jgi:hypothetical protein
MNAFEFQAKPKNGYIEIPAECNGPQKLDSKKLI